MHTASTKHAVRDSFFDLVRTYALRPIRSEEDLEKAMAMLRQLTTSRPEEEMDPGERDYVESLATLIQRFEKGCRRSALPKLTPIDRLKFLMAEQGMNISALGRVIGSQPNASLILRGKRSMSKAQILKLARHFSSSPALFME